MNSKPHPKERPRVTRTGITYTPQKTVEAEKTVAKAWTGPCYHGPVKVKVVFDKEGYAVFVDPVEVETPSKLRGDLDNYMKTILDGLNGIAWDDDKQVVHITAEKL